MHSFERQQQILDILRGHSFASVDFLCKKLYASPATVRRDISEMDERGLINKVRGGAAIIEGTNKDAPLLVRANKNREKKDIIAKLAIKYITNSMTIIMDSSSTVTVLAHRLESFQNATVLTSGIATLNYLNENTTLKVISSGGRISNKSAMTGQTAINTINNFHADIMFFSCCGFSIECGTTEAAEENAEVKKAMCKNAKQTILLCDSTKFNQEFFCKACAIQDIDIVITDKKPSDIFLQEAEKFLKVVYPK